MRLDLATVDSVIAQGPFSADWPSLESYVVPEWYQDAKFGIFLHWGVYAVPAFGNEWYPRQMYKQGGSEFEHHLKTYGPQKQFGYKDFIPHFRAENFDADRWAQLFVDAGARYVVPVAEHHDGFALYDSDFSEWTAVHKGPKRDLIGEQAAAYRKLGLHFGASSHRAEHCWFFNFGREFDSDIPDVPDLYDAAHGEHEEPSQAYLEDWLLRSCEIVVKYQPEIVWFDWKIEDSWYQPYLQRFAAFYYNHAAANGYPAAINYKLGAMPDAAGVFDVERGSLATLRGHFWQTDTSVCKKSWGAIADHDYRTVDSLVDDLIDIVSKNGCLLLNLAPRADGTIPDEQQAILRGMGAWLKVNGEAIYGTRPWKIFGEGPTQVIEGQFKENDRAAFTAADIRFTQGKDGTLYALPLALPEDGTLTVKSLAEQPITSVHLLGHAASLAFTQDADGLHVVLPATLPCEYALALAVR